MPALLVCARLVYIFAYSHSRFDLISISIFFFFCPISDYDDNGAQLDDQCFVHIGSLCTVVGGIVVN